MSYRKEWADLMTHVEKVLKNTKEEHSIMFKGDTFEWQRCYEIKNDPIYRQKFEFTLKTIGLSNGE